MPNLDIVTIETEETYEIRWSVLRPGADPSTVHFEGDDAPGTVHLGCRVEGALVGIATLLLAPLPEKPELLPGWQLRGMATLPAVRGLGCGKALVNRALELATAGGAAVLWCNARKHAVSFYEKLGLRGVGEEFLIAEVGPHLRMFRELASGPAE